jgi:ADP-heptose:LPS heptosyltransferase
MSIDDEIDGRDFFDIDEKIEAQAEMKIAVFRALQLGDMLCAIPAIRALRNCYPKAEITLLGLPWAASFVKRFPQYFDRFKHFPGYPGLPEQKFEAEATIGFIQDMQREKYDLVLQMQGDGSIINPLIELFNAKYIAGFYKEGHYYPNNGLFLEYPNDVHEIERHLKLMEFINVEPAGTDLEFPIYDQDWEELQKLHLPLTCQNYVCIHPGSRGNWRQWPPVYFAMLADYCASQDMQVVITGTIDEMEIVDDVVKHMQFQPIVVAGKTSLGAVAALIQNAYALVSNCTGVSHIAAALKTPSVVISMDGEPHRWAPLNKQLHFTIDWITTPDLELVYNKLRLLFGNGLNKKAA